jgi:hypothetical protein
MLRKTMIALLAAASVGVLALEAASARGGFHGGGFHGGGFHHGFGFGPGFALGAGIGLGLYAPYDYGGYYPGYYYGYDENVGCYLERRRVHTRSGWRLRTVEVCE